MNRKSIIGLALVGAIVASAAVMAAITFDPATGQGFVGKGDVQSAFGWNNARLQQRAGGVTFSYSVEVEQTVECYHENGNANLTRHGTRTGLIDSQIAYTARVHQQIDGFILDGYDPNNSSESLSDWENETQQGNDDIIPACFNNSQGWEAGQIQETIIAGPALFATWSGTTVQLQ